MLGALAAAAALAAPAAATPRAVLLVTPSPTFTVRGVRFEPRERVRLDVTAGGRFARTVLAGATGSFVARFPAVELGACGAYVVRAFGSRGSRATVRVLPECPPSGGPAP